MVTEDTQLRLRAMRMAQNGELQYSPVLSSDSPMAANASTPMAVAPNRGHWFSATTSRTTSNLSSPPSMRTFTPSMTMMALSVSMHRAMMSAPREIRSMSRSPFMYMTRNVATIVRNSTSPMMTPVLRPIVSSSTTTTMVTALARLNMKSLVASLTASGWKLISPISTPTGWYALSRSSVRRTPWPSRTTLPPCTVEM